MTAPPDAARASSRGVLYGLLVALVTLLAFRSILAGAFVYDDLLLVAHNPLVASFGNLGEAFARPYWEGLDPDGSGTVGLWRPLTTVALMIGHALGGGAPAGFHWVSLLLHLAAALAALRLATCVTGRPAVGLWTALLFAVHPVHVESVAWISGVCDPLAGVCGLLALSSFWSWRTGERGGVPWAAGLWFLLGLLAKETALATLPMVLVLDLLAPASERRARLRGWFPLVLAFVLYTFARMLVFGELTAGFLMVTTGFEVSAGRLAALRVELLGGFLQLLAWPLELNLFRPFHPELPEGDPTLAVAA
ncbi:MAG: hypothetical protein KC656_23025, partial [Myxococcales bacterium]|nr:hypothetical protein [Myxococcales bacterium]